MSTTRHITTAVVIIIFFVGTTLYYCYYEHWSVVESILFVVSTVTTVGFGYNAPTDDGSRVFTIFVILFGILFVLTSLLDMMYYILRYIQHRTASTLERLFVYSLILVLVILVSGALAFSCLQNFSFITGLYFAVETSTTLGFGDIPVNESIKVFLIFYVVISTLVIAFSFENFTSMRSKMELRRKKRSVLLNEADLVAIIEQAREVMGKVEFRRDEESKFDSDPNTSRDGGGEVRIGQYQFVVCMLAYFGTIQVEKEVLPWLQKFAELDVEGCGYLTKEKLKKLPMKSMKPVETEVLEDDSERRNNNKRYNTHRIISDYDEEYAKESR